MNTTGLHNLLESFEEYLGDATLPDSRFSFRSVIDYDEREEYPWALLDTLYRWGLENYFVPDEFGGKAAHVHEGFLLYRSVSRRDPTTAVSMVLSSIGFMPVWANGSREQKAWLSDYIRRGGTISWGLSEAARGSDILQNDTTARRVEGGYLLSGEKWLIGNCTVSGAITVFARTGKANAPNGFSLFVVEKNKIARDSFSLVPRARTLGLRGMDLSGIRFENAFIEESARIGAEGQGLEIALRASQMVRTMINTVALGCADTALRLTYDFASRRVIFGQRVSEIPYSAAQLVDCFSDVLIADAMALTATRILQGAPEQASISSSVVKYFVPTLLERTLDTLRIVLGARYFLRSDERYQMFQKMLRDIAVAGFADGNTVVNLKNLVHQVQPVCSSLAQSLSHGAPERVEQAATAVALMADLTCDLGPYRPSDQQLHSRGVDFVTRAMPDSVARLDETLAGSPLRARVVNRATTLMKHGAGLSRAIDNLKTSHGAQWAQSVEYFDFAKQFCAVYAAGCVIHWFLYQRSAVSEGFRDPAWLACALDRLWGMLYPLERGYDSSALERTMALLDRLHTEQRLFSFVDARVSGAANTSAALPGAA